MTCRSMLQASLVLILMTLAACDAEPLAMDAAVDAPGLDTLLPIDAPMVAPDAPLGSCNPDVTAPTIPQGITLAIEGAGVRAQWMASTDDVGVARYVLFRDGEELARPEGTSFLDMAGLVAGSTHAYWVEAVDASGRMSGRSLGASIAIPPRTTAGLDDAIDDDADGWLETSFGYRVRASHPRVICTPEHLAEMSGRMVGPSAREPYASVYAGLLSAAEAGTDVGPMGLALLYRVSGDRRWLDALLPRFSALTPSLNTPGELYYALDLVFDDVPQAVLLEIIARHAGVDPFLNTPLLLTDFTRVRLGYHRATMMASAIAYAGIFAFTPVTLGASAPAGQVNAPALLRGLHHQLLPEGHFFRTESHIAGDPSFRGRARIGEPGGAYDNMGYDRGEESDSIFVLHAWNTLTGEPRQRGALHDEARARFWHAMSIPHSETLETTSNGCRTPGRMARSVAGLWGETAGGGQPNPPQVLLAAHLYRDGLMQDFATRGTDASAPGCNASYRTYFALFFDDALASTPRESTALAHYFGGPGIVTSRSAWDAEATLLVALAGDGISRRYEDAGSFLLYRHENIVQHAGTRIRNTPDNDRHHWYFVRGASRNALRIYDPTEVFNDRGVLATSHNLVASDRLGGPMFETPYATVDMRFSLDSGAGTVQGRRAPADSPISELIDVGNVLRYEARPGVFTYALTEATPSYGLHVDSFEREFVHVLPDVVLLYDRVRVANATARRVWSAHTVGRPHVPDAPAPVWGLSEYGDADALEMHGADNVRFNVLLPTEHDVRVRGGETVFLKTPLRMGAPWTGSLAVGRPDWIELRASGVDTTGTVIVHGESETGASIMERVTLGQDPMTPRFREVTRVYTYGTPTALRAGEIDVAGAGWEPDQWVGFMVELAAGRFMITGNDADTLFTTSTATTSWIYRIVQVLGNTTAHFSRITRLETEAANPLDVAHLQLAVLHFYDTPDLSGRVHAFMPHTDGTRHGDEYGTGLWTENGSHTIEIESGETGNESRFLITIAMANPGVTPPTTERAEGTNLDAAIVASTTAIAFLRARGPGAEGSVTLPASVTTAHVFGLEPGAHYRATLGASLSVVPAETGLCASADGVLTVSR